MKLFKNKLFTLELFKFWDKGWIDIETPSIHLFLCPEEKHWSITIVFFVFSATIWFGPMGSR